MGHTDSDSSPDPSRFAPSPPAYSPLNDLPEEAGSPHPSDAETFQDDGAEGEDGGDELGPLTDDMFLKFKSKLEDAMKQHIAQLRTQARSSRYNKFNSKKRTTLQSREKKAGNYRAATRAAGYPPIYTFFHQVPAGNITPKEDVAIRESSQHEAETSGMEEGAAEAPTESRFLSEEAEDEPAGDGGTEVGSDRFNYGAVNTLSQCSSDSREESPTACREDESPPVQLVVDPQATQPEILAERTESGHLDGTTRSAGIDKQLDGEAAPRTRVTANLGGQDIPDNGVAAATAATLPLLVGEPVVMRTPALKRDSVELARVVVELEAVARRKALALRLRARVLVMLSFLRFYKSESLQKSWIEASELAAVSAGKGSYLA